MRCPSCRFVASDSHDICPKCLVDLRPQKKSLRLPIINPSLSYEELVAKLNSGGEGATIPHRKIVIQEKPSTLTERTTETTPAVGTKKASAAGGGEDLDSLLNEALKELGEPVVATAPKAPAHSATETEPPKLEEAPPAAIQTVVRPPPPEPIDEATKDRIRNLFDEAAPSITLENASIEFGAGDLQNSSRTENIRILFDLAADSLTDPTLLDRLEERVVKSENRAVESQELSSELKKVERVLSRPTFSLRTGSKIAKTKEKTSDTLQLAPPEKRKAALWYDLTLVIAVAILTTVFEIYRSHKALWVKLTFFSFGEITALDLIFPAAVFLASILVLSILYPLLALLIFKTTPGGWAYKLSVESLAGGAPKNTQIAVRCLSLPLSVLTLGVKAVFKGGQARHDLVSATAVTVEPI